MSQKLTVFRQKRLGSFIKTAFYVLPTKVSKNCFLRKTNFLFFLGFSASAFLDMDEKLSIALLELHSTCPANVSTKLVFLNFLLQLSEFERKEVWLLLVISVVIVGTTFYVFKSSLWEKFFLVENIL